MQWANFKGDRRTYRGKVKCRIPIVFIEDRALPKHMYQPIGTCRFCIYSVRY